MGIIRADRIVHTRARNNFTELSITKNNFAPLKVNGRLANDVECVLYCAEVLRKNPGMVVDRNIRRLVNHIDEAHKQGTSMDKLKDMFLDCLDFSNYQRPKLEGDN